MKIVEFFDKTFIKFVIVGIVNTLFGTAVMFVSYNLLNFGYWVSSALNYVLGSILSYFLNKYFTFENKEKSIKVILKFIINILICYLIAYGLAKPLAILVLSGSSKKLQENIAMLVGMGFFIMLNYVGQRFFAFAPSKDIKENTSNNKQSIEKNNEKVNR